MPKSTPKLCPKDNLPSGNATRTLSLACSAVKTVIAFAFEALLKIETVANEDEMLIKESKILTRQKAIVTFCQNLIFASFLLIAFSIFFASPAAIKV
jgi:hypothetical protein